MELIRDNWTKNDYDDFVGELRSYADEKYRSFHSSLIPDMACCNSTCKVQRTDYAVHKVKFA